MQDGGIHMKWDTELNALQQMMDQGVSLEGIGGHYGVSKQRIYQVLTQYGLQTPVAKQKNYLRDKPPEMYWLNKMLVHKQVPKKQRSQLLETLVLPKNCPVLGMQLRYGTGGEGWTRVDASASLDQIVPQGGYILGNIQIISWRANRIKNDATPGELRLLADYIELITNT